ncbi:MAG: RNA methyltransferase [Dissulfurimicrobium sp.]|uniref:RNA methyltransferase n=1 Tax=Dissulfurimicrobium sp. TaxID=2022436 RepID=UPI00404A3BFA
MIHIALVHYPVLNKRGEVIVSAVTNLDIHDIARVSKTYGIAGYYVVTPVVEQQTLVKELISHWSENVGGTINPDRRVALDIVRIAGSLVDVKEDITHKTGTRPIIYATSAKHRDNTLRWSFLKKRLLDKDFNLLLLFGTAFGLAEELLNEIDGILEPIEGTSGYNHLPVRCAVAIAIDRLLSNDRQRDSI